MKQLKQLFLLLYFATSLKQQKHYNKNDKDENANLNNLWNKCQSLISDNFTHYLNEAILKSY